uniref:GST N-terminal domain-containing protein n=1 Tax=Hemiselmis andersenii TaxID=464988 RepID=A0A7S1DEY1_HEMAN|mmetsp:Transcript_10779/g.26161  ORF Transcript_10779/g.26161 Transcript_10779/m.26161 type:complete len:339 (+) Transcript_10779:59-1075(+)
MTRSLALVLCVSSLAIAHGFVAPAGLRSVVSAPSVNKLPVASASASRLASPLSPRMTLTPSSVAHPEQVIVGSPLPIVYVYDHCPFCVRVRAIFGAKNIKHEVRFMANDDIDTPTKLVGKKIAPIMEIPTKNEVMMESLDIVKRIDEDPTMGPSVLLPGTDRTDLKAWQKKHQDLFRSLQRPRYVASGLLPEFALKAGRDAFVKNHPVPPFEKPDWKSDNYDMATRYAKYNECMGKTDELLPQANTAVEELEGMIFSAKHASEVPFPHPTPRAQQPQRTYPATPNAYSKSEPAQQRPPTGGGHLWARRAPRFFFVTFLGGGADPCTFPLLSSPRVRVR